MLTVTDVRREVGGFFDLIGSMGMFNEWWVVHMG